MAPGPSLLWGKKCMTITGCSILRRTWPRRRKHLDLKDMKTYIAYKKTAIATLTPEAEEIAKAEDQEGLGDEESEES
jgi:hypothetical protein